MEIIPIQVHQLFGCVPGAAAKRVKEGKEQDGMMMVLQFLEWRQSSSSSAERDDGCCDGSL